MRLLFIREYPACFQTSGCLPCRLDPRRSCVGIFTGHEKKTLVSARIATCPANCRKRAQHNNQLSASQCQIGDCFCVCVLCQFCELKTWTVFGKMLFSPVELSSIKTCVFALLWRDNNYLKLLWRHNNSSRYYDVIIVLVRCRPSVMRLSIRPLSGNFRKTIPAISRTSQPSIFPPAAAFKIERFCTFHSRALLDRCLLTRL